MALPPGTRLGVYEITAPIGEGAMGQVYRATDTTLGRQIANKIRSSRFSWALVCEKQVDLLPAFRLLKKAWRVAVSVRV